MAGGRKFVAPELFREFARAGARIRLVLLEKERMAIHQEFPELGEAIQETKGKGKKANGVKKRVANGMQTRIMDYFGKATGLAAFPREIAAQLKVDQKQANNAMYHLAEKKALKRDGKGRYKLPVPKEAK